ncbi:MarR family winged helix-turn-helix transcriptional regulator [Actinokineospora auranticolor]|uniref:DNA-binding MarR family transcriptional regulator n=1 Tax=Actinokineospora auranticolor TaxID=155976 RepID=A0A2S6GNX5_9PSEU|nr:MarR family winged helix-turn-helix transcriptional regulator [Actinokineospora auranticolor]PPK66886.1 DNA-binding MarR family transcriptional regulator [Actinokineospora auranticolor]
MPQPQGARNRLDEAVWLVDRLAEHAQRALRDRFAEHGMHKRHYVVLAALAETGSAYQDELGRLPGLEGCDLVALLDGLKAAGQADRKPHPVNRLRNVVTLTDEGALALQRLDVRVRETESEILAPLSHTERDQLVALLKRVAPAGDLRSRKDNPA